MTQTSNSINLVDFIRDVPDFPKPGIVFKDITPIFQDPAGLQHTVDLFVERLADQHIDKVKHEYNH